MHRPYEPVPIMTYSGSCVFEKLNGSPNMKREVLPINVLLKGSTYTEATTMPQTSAKNIRYSFADDIFIILLPNGLWLWIWCRCLLSYFV